MTLIEPKILKFQQIGNPSEGFISVAEKENLPFTPKRIFWTYNVPDNIIRGRHAHKKIEQILIAVNGIIEVKTLHNKKETVFELNTPNIGLFLPKFTWTFIKFSPNSTLLCLANENYDENDYIRDFDEFMKNYF